MDQEHEDALNMTKEDLLDRLNSGTPVNEDDDITCSLCGYHDPEGLDEHYLVCPNRDYVHVYDICPGKHTLDEVIKDFEFTLGYLRDRKDDGWHLSDPVDDGYIYLEKAP